MDGFDDAQFVPPAAPDHLGHRKRLKDRFMKTGAEGVADYELLELVLFLALPRRDTKPIAKMLLKRFGSFAEVLTASPARLREIKDMGDSAVAALKIIEAASQRIARGGVQKRPVLSSLPSVVDYCRAAIGFAEREEVRILFLDKRNMLIQDETHAIGTVDNTPAYPREIVKRALELSATAIVMVHNHPSGDPSPSQADIALTQQIVALSKPLGIEVHDHLIVGRNGHTSLRKLRLM